MASWVIFSAMLCPFHPISPIGTRYRGHENLDSSPFCQHAPGELLCGLLACPSCIMVSADEHQAYGVRYDDGGHVASAERSPDRNAGTTSHGHGSLDTFGHSQGVCRSVETDSRAGTVVGVGIDFLGVGTSALTPALVEIDAMERCDCAVWVLHTGNQGRVIGKVLIFMAIRQARVTAEHVWYGFLPEPTMLQIAGYRVSRGDSMGLTPDTLQCELSPLDVIRGTLARAWSWQAGHRARAFERALPAAIVTIPNATLTVDR